MDWVVLKMKKILLAEMQLIPTSKTFRVGREVKHVIATPFWN